MPLDLAPILRTLLFDRLDTVVLTSATLAAGGDFGFLESRLGLAGEDSPVTVREVFPSPFDYPSQCVFGIPNDLPEPREDEHAHATAVVQVVTDLAYASDGGHVRALHQPRLAPAGGARAPRGARAPAGPSWCRAKRRGTSCCAVSARRRTRSCSAPIRSGKGWTCPGARSAPWCSTSYLSRCRSEPLTAARLERLAEEGQDGFMNYLLPHAALKLKQGFGRLIRSRQDMGVVVLLDSRVVTKRYGPLLLGGLPRAERIIGSWAQVRTKCEDFFARHGIGAIA